MKENNLKNIFKNTPFSFWDWGVFLFFGILCYISFQHSDLVHTATAGLGFLSGHLLDFYDYGSALIGGINYMPSTFILFGIWDIPIYLLGIVTEPTMGVPVAAVMWFKLLPVLCYGGSGILLYKIGLEMGLKPATAKALFYLSLIAPIGFFSQFIFQDPYRMAGASACGTSIVVLGF